MLHEISGEKIRRQYFNIPIYLLLSMYTAIISAVMTASVADHTLGSSKWFEELLFLFIVIIASILPLVILSVLNRFYFGRVICVLSDKGLYYENNGICHVFWNDIKQVVYEPDVPGKLGHRCFCCNTAHITIKPFKKKVELELDHAPFFLLRKVRKYNPNVKCDITAFGWVMILFYLFGPSAGAALVVLFG